MATVDAPAREIVGDCRYCVQRDGQPTGGSKLYAAEPHVLFPDGQVAHVACEIDSRRRGGW